MLLFEDLEPQGPQITDHALELRQKAFVVNQTVALLP